MEVQNGGTQQIVTVVMHIYCSFAAVDSACIMLMIYYIQDTPDYGNYSLEPTVTAVGWIEDD